MAVERLSNDAVERVSGPAWQSLRQPFLDMSETLLGVSSESVGVLTTIYVKYQLTGSPSSDVFAVAWLKNSRQLVLGLALPLEFESPLLVLAPTGMKYKGITKYLIVKPGDILPSELSNWAKAAYDHAMGQVKA